MRRLREIISSSFGHLLLIALAVLAVGYILFAASGCCNCNQPKDISIPPVPLNI